MDAQPAAVLHVADAQAAAGWYRRHLGFTTEWEHRFAARAPANPQRW
ncbi:MAG: hypothetical protein ACRDYU_05375 [Actinomycetes bacterium]